MAKQKYGRKPKKELTRKQARAAKSNQKKRATAKKASGKSSKKDKTPSLLARLSNQQTKKALWIGIGLCLAFIVIATVILVNMYTVFTRSQKIDLYEESFDYYTATQELSLIQQKYHMTYLTLNTEKMNEVDRFNYKLMDYVYNLSNNNQSQLDIDQDYGRYETFLPKPDETMDIAVNDASGLTVPVQYVITADSFTVTIAGETFEQKNLINPDNYIYTAVYDESDATMNRVIICGDNGEYYRGSKAFAYYYDGEKAYYIGEIPVNVYQMSTPKDGGFTFATKGSLLQEWPYNTRAAMDQANGYALKPQAAPEAGWYDLTYSYQVFLRTDLTVYESADLASTTAVLPVTTVLEIVGTDNASFLRCLTTGGGYCFIHMTDDNTVDNGGTPQDAKAVMFGLSGGYY